MHIKEFFAMIEEGKIYQRKDKMGTTYCKYEDGLIWLSTNKKTWQMSTLNTDLGNWEEIKLKNPKREE